MPLASHLREARTRLIRAAVVLVAGLVLGFWLSDAILDLLRAPVEELARTMDASLNYESVTGAFDLTLKIALYAGLVMASPALLYELLAYVLPGLTWREKQYTLGFLTAGVTLFAAGCWVGVTAFPRMVTMLAGFASQEDSTILAAGEYVDFVLKVVLATGLAFVVPVGLVLLNVLGVLPGRTIVRGWRVAVITIVVFSALITPSADVLSMFVIAIPMVGLYLVAAVVARTRDGITARRARALLDSTPDQEVAPCSA
ncbi:twin-arginine translocase subunit TatC [Actinotalea sp. BY-33]|uniref:Sec-independent protein translocase protein TatC n=2 Tax=Actinotalea soli TaxID=2819234 RepID=A0A939LU39_9CELL|nr:twin-arginine translocase subunit TatC [Actinotalea soli]